MISTSVVVQSLLVLCSQTLKPLHSVLCSCLYDIVIKMGEDIVSRLDRRIDKFSFHLINHDKPAVQNKNKFKLDCSRLT